MDLLATYCGSEGAVRLKYPDFNLIELIATSSNLTQSYPIELIKSIDIGSQLKYVLNSIHSNIMT